MNTPRLLLVEDDAAVADVVALHLRGAGFDVEHAADGHQALRRIESQRYSLVLLDVMLPGTDGFEICRRLRAQEARDGPAGHPARDGSAGHPARDGSAGHPARDGSAGHPARDGPAGHPARNGPAGHPARIGPAGPVPIIILSARTTEAERVLGLELGADDYLPKPFSMLELTARVRALLRRVDQLQAQLLLQATAQVLQVGSLHIDINRREAALAGQPLNLTLREFDLLHFMARHPGQIFSRAELLQRVWGDGFDGFEHTVNSHINRLRSKLEGDTALPGTATAPTSRLIETVWGLGYRFNAPGLSGIAVRSSRALGSAQTVVAV